MTNEEKAIAFIDAAIKQLEGALRNVVDIRLHDESITELMRVKFKLEGVVNPNKTPKPVIGLQS